MKIVVIATLIGVGLCLLGIDLGSKFIKIALEELGSGDRVIENEMSKRQTHNLISVCSDGV